MTHAGVPPKRKLRVLIADDIQETRRNTRLMLSMISDVEVVAIAHNGLQAVNMAKEHHPDTGCIIISAEKDPETLRDAMSIGIRDYLFKPFTVDQLEQAIEKVRTRLENVCQRSAQSEQLRQRNEAYLKQLADEYVKSRRTDDQAVEVFEQLAATRPASYAGCAPWPWCMSSGKTGANSTPWLPGWCSGLENPKSNRAINKTLWKSGLTGSRNVRSTKTLEHS